MKSKNPQSTFRKAALTLLELLVVVLIISILSTIATGVYINQTRRARIAATQDLIHQLELAITRYEVDTGELPPSGSTTVSPPPALAGNVGSYRDGSGLLQLALVHSLSGSTNKPSSATWNGAYINLQSNQIAATDSGQTQSIGNYDVLDSWGNPVMYIRHQDYTIQGSNFSGGTRMFGSPVEGQNPDLPAPNPYLYQGETYYNPSSYQIISTGPDGKTLGDTVALGNTYSYKGGAEDDVTNFGY